MSGIPTGDWSWIDGAARRFEQAWRKGPRPRIEDYLAKVAEPQRPLLLGRAATCRARAPSAGGREAKGSRSIWADSRSMKS